MARAVASDRFIKLALTGTEEAVKRAFIAAAQRKLAEVEATAKPTEIIRFVDRVKGRPLSAVQPYGVVHFRFTYWRRIVEAAMEILENTSPVDSGKYQEMHTLFADSKQIAIASEIGQARRVVIANDCPYARVIERGMWGRVPWSKQPQVPAQGVYKAAAAALKRRFGHLVDIQQTFVGVDTGTMLSGAAANASANRFPALVMEAR